LQPKHSEIDIAGIKLSILDDVGMMKSIESALANNKQCTIAYCNARTVNYTYEDKEFKDVLKGFDIVHPDGVGVYLASRFLYGSKGQSARFSGSDYYDVLIDYCASQKKKLFFFGHDDETLEKIQAANPELKIAGLQNGYDYDDNTDILICGLGMPRQENWIKNNRGKLNCSVLICVGEGIRVFSGTKLRGPLLLRKLGLEWLIRFLSDPFRYFGRYIIGNPLFLYRIIVLKLRNLRR
jgi:N-acetylglucosaminyldiphosphoundecaprenol N-acetyl-beta-D-mannosaminyltransferase